MRVSELTGIDEHQREHLEAIETKNDLLELIADIGDSEDTLVNALDAVAIPSALQVIIDDVDDAYDAMIVAIDGVVFTAPQQAAIDYVGAHIAVLVAVTSMDVTEELETETDAVETAITALNASDEALLEELHDSDNDTDDGKISTL
jgi:hypothetical protein